MDYVDFIASKENVSIKNIIPLIQQIYVNDHSWNIDDSVLNVIDNKRRYVVNSVLIDNIDNNVIEGKLVDGYAYFENGFPVIDEETGLHVTEIKFDQSYVNIKSLVEYLVKHINNVSNIPSKLLDTIGIKNPNYQNHSNAIDPSVKKELSELREQKKRWGDSIEAAVKIGLLFYEGELNKPSIKEEFIEEFRGHFGSGLPDTAVEKIYKALPVGYKKSGGRPKKNPSDVNIENIILAAAFAGTLHEAPERLKLLNLKNELKDNSIAIPDDEILKKIIQAVNNLDI